MKDIVAQAKLNASMAASRAAANTKFKQQTTIAINGGLFSITPEFLNFLQLLISRNMVSAVLIDTYNTPVLVENITQFNAQCFNAYMDAVDQLYSTTQQLKNTRTTFQLTALK